MLYACTSNEQVLVFTHLASIVDRVRTYTYIRIYICMHAAEIYVDIDRYI
jgi:hypothetical protein